MTDSEYNVLEDDPAVEDVVVMVMVDGCSEVGGPVGGGTGTDVNRKLFQGMGEGGKGFIERNNETNAFSSIAEWVFLYLITSRYRLQFLPSSFLLPGDVSEGTLHTS